MQPKNTNSAFIHVDWPIKNVLAFSTTRQSPELPSINQPPFEHFNIATHVGDNVETVMHNRQVLSSYLPVSSQIQWLDQVHGANVVEVNKVHEQPPEADAAITRQRNVALSVMTADCLPILLADKRGEEIAVIHAGWRPLAQNIISETIAKMKTPVQSLSAWLGPCISQKGFEVGSEVKQAFIALDSDLASAFQPGQADKQMACIPTIARWQLNQAGVTDIYQNSACTYTDSERFYSYRRDGQTGRMVSVIVMT